MKNISKITFTLLSITIFINNPVVAEIVFEQQPMYGQNEKIDWTTQPDLDNIIANAIHTFGTAEHASEGYTEKGFDLFLDGKYNKSMKRFNQAWLLNQENPYPYLGFGLLMQKNEQACEAYRMFKLANEKGLNEYGFLADYAYTTSQCAIQKDSDQKEELFNLSNNLHEQASQTSSKKLLAYVYQSWAKSFFLQENIDKTNEMITASRNLGGEIEPGFIEQVNNYKN